MSKSTVRALRMADISSAYLRSQRERPAVLKGELAKIRSAQRCALVFILEGPDDLVVYDVWIRRIAPTLHWEALVANGKRNLLEFREMMARDRTGLSMCTYFIVDHDYDALKSQKHGPDIFVLPAHSVENYLSAPEVLESILRSDLQVLGDPVLRKKIVDTYAAALDTYASLLIDPCLRLHASNGRGVGNVQIDENCLRPFQISLDGTIVVDVDLRDRLVATERLIPEEAIEVSQRFFEVADLRLWIRGKFLIQLLRKWVDLLFKDRKSDAPTVFPNSAPSLNIRPATVDVRSLSAKSTLPSGLTEFILEYAQRCVDLCA